MLPVDFRLKYLRAKFIGSGSAMVHYAKTKTSKSWSNLKTWS